MTAPSIEIDLAASARDCARHALASYTRAGHGNPMLRDDWLHAIATGDIAVGDATPFEQISMDDAAIIKLSAKLACRPKAGKIELEQEDINTMLAALWHASEIDVESFPQFLTGDVGANLPQQRLFVRLADAAGMTAALAHEYFQMHAPKSTPTP